MDVVTQGQLQEHHVALAISFVSLLSQPRLVLTLAWSQLLNVVLFFEPRTFISPFLITNSQLKPKMHPQGERIS